MVCILPRSTHLRRRSGVMLWPCWLSRWQMLRAVWNPSGIR